MKGNYQQWHDLLCLNGRVLFKVIVAYCKEKLKQWINFHVQYLCSPKYERVNTKHIYIVFIHEGVFRG